jgi:ATP synthase protein I
VSDETTPKQVTRTYDSAWTDGSAFVSSILAGTLLGFLADKWLGTEPWLIVIGILLGSYAGFAKMWVLSKKMEEDPRER